MPYVILNNYLHHLIKYGGKGTSKIAIFKVFSELEKKWNCSLGFSKFQFPITLINLEKLGSIHSPRPIFQNPNLESMDELGKVMC